MQLPGLYNIVVCWRDGVSLAPTTCVMFIVTPLNAYTTCIMIVHYVMYQPSTVNMHYKPPHKAHPCTELGVSVSFLQKETLSVILVLDGEGNVYKYLSVTIVWEPLLLDSMGRCTS